MKSIRLVLTVFFLISFCSNSSTPISVSSLNDIIGSTTNKIEVSNSNWKEYIGKSNDGNFVALRVDAEIDPEPKAVEAKPTTPAGDTKQTTLFGGNY